jgi:hypothetical protein
VNSLPLMAVTLHFALIIIRFPKKKGEVYGFIPLMERSRIRS